MTFYFGSPSFPRDRHSTQHKFSVRRVCDRLIGAVACALWSGYTIPHLDASLCKSLKFVGAAETNYIECFWTEVARDQDEGGLDEVKQGQL